MFSVAPPAPAPVSIGGLNIPLRKKKISDDEEILLIISQHLARTRREKDEN